MPNRNAFNRMTGFVDPDRIKKDIEVEKEDLDQKIDDLSKKIK